MSNLIPLSVLTDEELLGRVYITSNSSQMEIELAARLQHALDELKKAPTDVYDVVTGMERQQGG